MPKDESIEQSSAEQELINFLSQQKAQNEPTSVFSKLKGALKKDSKRLLPGG